jgi:hypothetical protein
VTTDCGRHRGPIFPGGVRLGEVASGGSAIRGATTVAPAAGLGPARRGEGSEVSTSGVEPLVVLAEVTRPGANGGIIRTMAARSNVHQRSPERPTFLLRAWRGTDGAMPHWCELCP